MGVAGMVECCERIEYQTNVAKVGLEGKFAVFAEIIVAHAQHKLYTHMCTQASFIFNGTRKDMGMFVLTTPRSIFLSGLRGQVLHHRGLD
jgi:hypothetical protein